MTDGDRETLAAFYHSLKSPLSAIQGASELMLKAIGGEPSPRHRELLEVISQRVKALTLYLDELRKTSWAEAGVVAVPCPAGPPASPPSAPRPSAVSDPIGVRPAGLGQDCSTTRR
jgi:signal transduction histidine kinase